jgi:cytochrome c-type biogenesis protein CcmF
MTAQIGEFALSLAILAAVSAVLASFAAARFGSDRLITVSKALMAALAGLLSVAVFALAIALISSDFRIAYVGHYTERALPLGYKLAALWAGQEGSILLWGWLLAVLCTIFAVSRRDLRGDAEGSAVMATLGINAGFFAALLLFAANPFKLADAVPADGRGLNPLLQDPAMIAHPPVLFLGYAGYTIPFALLIGALVAGRRDNQWLAGTRRWLLASWLFLTAGILLGAQWAYVELGWGGYWAWDPVENASLLPWLTGTALLHSIMIQQHRGMFKKWNATLIAASFVLCIFGTYLTRSGVIQSVHAFGESLIGTFFLGFLIVSAVASLFLLVLRWRELRGEHELEGLIGREVAFLATNALLVGMMLATLVGTMFPLISRATLGREVSVGPAFYNKVVAPMGLLLIALMSVGPLLGYGDGAAKRLARGLLVPAGVAVLAVAFAWARGLHNTWALLATAIVALGVACVLTDFATAWFSHLGTCGNPLFAIVRLIDGNHRRYGGQLAHIGMFMVMIGVVGSSLFGVKETFTLAPGQTVAFAGQTLRYNGLREVRMANYTAVQADVTFTAANGKTTSLLPQRRFYDKHEDANTEVAIASDWKRDVYLTLAGWEKGGESTAIQAIVNPLVSWIWTGGIVMAAGALLCLLPRFLPHGAPEGIAAARPAKVQLRVPGKRVSLKASA